MPNDNVIEILFGVKGGGELSGESGRKIKTELDRIANQISLQVKVDQKYFKEQLLKLKADLESTLGNLKIKVETNNQTAATNKTGNSSGSKDNSKLVAQKKAYTELIRLAGEYKKALSKAVTTPEGSTKLFDTYAKQVKSKLREINKAKKESANAGLISDEQKKSIDDLISKYKKLAKAEKEAFDIKLQEKYTNSIVPGYDKQISKGEQLYSTYNFLINHNKEAKAAYDALRMSMNQPLSSNPVEAAQQVKALGAQVSKTSAILGELQIKTDTVGNKIKKAFETGVIQKFAYAFLALSMNAIRQVYKNVTELDKAMTELRIVTRATSKQYAEFATTVAKSAKEIGASVEDLIRSTTTFARLGYKIKEAQELAKLTTQYSNVSGVSVSDATTNITAILKAYDLGAKDLEDVLDRIIYIGNNYAISQAEIGIAMNNAASALSANGNSLQESMGLLTAANVTMQDVNKSSTAIRTIAARISKSTAELDELGEDAGTIMATADLDAQMRAYGVAIVDANGELRSTYAILADLHEKWDSLDSTSRAAIANMMAGTRQQTAFYSIMQNWGDAESIVANQAAAYGSLEKANDEYVNSIQGKMGQIGATWEEFSQNILNSNLVKFVLDIVKGIANALNAVSSVGDGLLIQIPLIGVALAAIYALLIKIKGTQVWSVFLTGLKKLFAPITKVIAILRQKAAAHRDGAAAATEEAMAETAAADTMENASKKTAISSGEIIGSIATAAAALGIIWTIMDKGDKWVSWVVMAGAIIVGVIAGIGLAVKIAAAVADGSIKAFMASNPIGWILGLVTAIGALVMAIINLCKKPSYEDLKEAAEDAKNAWSEFNDELKETKSELESINQQIKDLEDKIANGEPLTLVEEKQLAALEQAKNITQQQLEAQEEAANFAGQEAAKAVGEAIDKYNSDKKTSKKGILDLFGKASGGNWAKLSTDEKKQISDYMAEIYDNRDEFDYYVPTYDENGAIKEGLSDWQIAVNEYWDDYYSMLDRLSVAKGDYATAWSSVKNRIKYSDAFKELKEYANGAHVTAEGLQELADTKPAVKELFDYMNEIGIGGSMGAMAEQVKELADGLKYITKEKYTDQLEKFNDAFSALNTALKDVSETGIIANDNIQELLKEFPNLTDKYFELTDQGYQLRNPELSTQDVLREYAIEGLQKYVDQYNKAMEDLAEHQDDDFTAQATENVANAQENLNKAISTYATLLRTTEFEAAKDALEAQQDALEEQLDVYEELIELRKQLLETYQEEVEYKKELNKKQTAVADLQTQLSLAQLDASAAGQARARKLQSELDKAQEELNSFTLENAIEKLEDYLDADNKEYQAFINQKVAELQETIDNLAKNFKLKFNTDTNPITITPEYHTGGNVGNVTKLKSGEEFAKLLKGEHVSTPAQIENFMRNTLPTIARSGWSAVIQNNSPLIELNCGSVTKDTLPDLENIVNKAVERVSKEMQNALSRTGYRKNSNK